MRPYLGVSCLVLRARNRAFSAPRIWTVDAGCLASDTSEPAWAMRRAPTSSPTRAVRLGAMAAMRLRKYSYSSVRYWVIEMTWSARRWMWSRSESEISVPIDTAAADLSASSSSSGRTLEKSVVL